MNGNPLKQFFRRPSIYITLPSKGRFYTPDIYESTENGEIPVYPMSAIDEITSKTPDAVFSGQAVVDIIQSCVPNIKNAWKLNIIDVEAIIIAIRIASTGEEMDVTSTCPSCSNEANYGINLVDLLSAQRDVNYEDTLKIRELEVKFKPLTLKESNANNLAQYEIQRIAYALQNQTDEESQKQVSDSVRKLNDLLTEMIAATIEHVRTPETVVNNPEYIKDFLKNCDRQTSNAVKDKSVSLKTQNDIKPMKLKCMNCQHEYEQELMLNITDFFA